MSSPFDQAMARPLLDEPTRKKWCISKPDIHNWFVAKKVAAAISDDCETITFGAAAADDDDDDGFSPDCIPSINVNGISGDSSLKETNKDPLSFSIGDPGESDDTSSLEFSVKSTSSSLIFEATLVHPLDILPAPDALLNDNEYNEDGPLTTIELVDLERADTNLELLRERQTELSCIHTDMRQIHTIQQDIATLVDSHQSDINDLSWNAITAFDHAESGLEHLVETLALKQERRSKLYSFLASTAVVLAVCYVVVGFISPDDHQQQASALVPSSDSGAYSPKFLIRHFQEP